MHAGYMCKPTRPVSVLHIHDPVSDTIIPFDGSRAALGGYLYESVEDVLTAASADVLSHCELAVPENQTQTLRTLASRSKASPDAVVSSSELPWLHGLSLAGRNSSSDLDDGECRLYARCEMNVGDIVLCTGRFGHDWPPWAAAVAWRFFAYHFEARRANARPWVRLEGHDGSAQPSDVETREVLAPTVLHNCYHRDHIAPLPPAPPSSSLSSPPMMQPSPALDIIVSTAGGIALLVAIISRLRRQRCIPARQQRERLFAEQVLSTTSTAAVQLGSTM
eukprot:CAMPEP_0115867490 /NCGR_PEP_ID=MMETSP0287-20121206/20794_1 /TAXON_ID=412157 /ORGANISM="Chrysochromulina rotalis, Strain UIO044" /LENGTH=277 /DNA_ID=CAMNT_0003322095 /DNA_START=12 /DNA_END=845 /DNA_ORIENTATION=+